MGADLVVLNPGIGGAKVAVEDLGDGRVMPVSKVYTGDEDGSPGSPVSRANPLPTDAERTSTATRTSVAAATGDQIAIAANSLRRGVFFFNDSDGPAYLALGTTPASTSDFTFEIPSHDSWYPPFNYDGEVHVVWLAVSGTLHITELT